MSGCDFEKKRFIVYFGNGKLGFWSKDCSNCANENSNKCNDCHHWSAFKWRKLKNENK